MKWITLTKFTDRGKAYINASQICAVYRKYSDNNVTIVDFVGADEKYLEVLESPEAIMNLIKGEVTT